MRDARCLDDYPPATNRVFRSPEAAILLELRVAQAHTIASRGALDRPAARVKQPDDTLDTTIAIGTDLNLPYSEQHWLNRSGI